jgi:hypothetical protein
MPKTKERGMYHKKLESDIRCPLEYGLEVFGGKWCYRYGCYCNRLSGTWTLEQYEGQYRSAMYAAVKSANPNWKPDKHLIQAFLIMSQENP